MSNLVTLYQHDPLLIFVRSTEETIESFGSEYLEEYGLLIDANLLEKYRRVSNEYKAIQNELRKYLE